MTDEEVEKTFKELFQAGEQNLKDLAKVLDDRVEILKREAQRTHNYAVSIAGAVLAIVSTLALFAWFIICLKIDSRIEAERYIEARRTGEIIASSNDSLRHEIERQIDLLVKQGGESEGRRTSARKNRRYAY
jgi:hypothetical protein